MRKNKFNVGDVVYCVRFGTITQAKIIKSALSKEEMIKDLKWAYELDTGEGHNIRASEDELCSTFEDVIKRCEKEEEELAKRCKETSLASFLKGE